MQRVYVRLNLCVCVCPCLCELRETVLMLSLPVLCRMTYLMGKMKTGGKIHGRKTIEGQIQLIKAYVSNCYSGYL